MTLLKQRCNIKLMDNVDQNLPYNKTTNVTMVLFALILVFVTFALFINTLSLQNRMYEHKVRQRIKPAVNYPDDQTNIPNSSTPSIIFNKPSNTPDIYCLGKPCPTTYNNDNKSQSGVN